jgi:hypothetical protein
VIIRDPKVGRSGTWRLNSNAEVKQNIPTVFTVRRTSRPAVVKVISLKAVAKHKNGSIRLSPRGFPIYAENPFKQYQDDQRDVLVEVATGRVIQGASG